MQLTQAIKFLVNFCFQKKELNSNSKSNVYKITRTLTNEMKNNFLVAIK